MKEAICVALALGFFQLSAVPQSEANEGLRFEYPELSVTPRATERLRIEAERESERKWNTHLPIQVSALATMTSGFFLRGKTKLNDDPDRLASLVGIATGGAWLAATIVLAQTFRPYQSGLEEVKNYPARNKREELARERFAEEAIFSPARLANRLTLLSFLTNAGASVYMFSKAEKNSLASTAAVASAVLSLTPFFFPYHWKDVARTHERYKKRIYGPVTSAGFLTEPVTGHPAPGLTLSLRF